MKADRIKIALMAVLLASLLWPSPSSADTFFDFYLGQASTESARVTVTYQPFFGSSETATRNVSFDTSGELGIRGVVWNALQPAHGFGLGMSSFDASGAGVDIDVLAFSFIYMARKRMHVSERFETGRLQPYLSMGLLLVDASGEFDFRPEVSGRVSASGSALGPDLRLGLRWLASESGALMAELRYTRASLDMEAFIWSDTAKADLETTHLYLGFSARY